MANGYITIGTELKTDKFDRQIDALEKRMAKEEKKKIDIEVNISKNTQQLNDIREEVDRLAESYQRMKNLQDKLESGKATPSDFSSFSEMQKEFGSLEQLDATFQKAMDKQDAMEMKASKLNDKYAEINQNVTDYATKIESVKFDKQQADIARVKEGFDRVGSSIQSAVKQAGRMVLSIIGIRTGLAMLRRASSELATYDTQYAANLEYIRFALTQMIAPVLRYIVGLVATILSYINAIVSAWFGINLFSNASAKNFQKMKAGAGGTAKAVKEIKKQLAGFDEINMLSDTSSSGGGGGGGGIASPSFDLGGDVKIPKWLQWIIDNKDLILAVLAGIASAILALKLGLGAIKALGIGIMVTGIIKLVKDILKFIKEPTWKNFGKILQDIGIILVGLGLVTGQWTIAIAGLAIGIVGLVTELWNEQKGIMSVTEAQEKLKQATDELASANDEYISSVDRAEDALKKLTDAEEQTGLSGEELNKMVEQGTLDYKNMTEEQKKVYKAYLDNDKAQKNLKDSTDKLTEAKKKEKTASWDLKLATMAEKGEFDKYKKAVVDAFERGELSADEARDLIEKAMAGMSDSAKQTFGYDLPDKISNGLEPWRYESMANKFRHWWNSFIESLNKNIRLAVSGNFSVGGGGGGGASYNGGRALGALYFPPKMKLWTGGIINMPRKRSATRFKHRRRTRRRRCNPINTKPSNGGSRI